MTRFHVISGSLDFEVIAVDDADALSQAVDADLLRDGDMGGIEVLPEPKIAPFEPEGPG